MFPHVQPHKNQQRSPGQTEVLEAASVFAAAAAVIASAEATVLQEQVDAADIAAATAWACVPVDVARIFDLEREAWLASQHASDLAVEHNRIARRAVIAATLAAEAVARGLTAEDYASSELLSDRIAAIHVAKTVVLHSDATLHSAARAHAAMSRSR